jgi:hypothetical protein
MSSCSKQSARQVGARRGLLCSAALVPGLVLTAPTNAAARPAAPPSGRKPAQQVPAAPKEVLVGAYVMHIHEISIRENYFTADFYLWFRWKDDKLTPYNTFSLVDAREEKITEPVTQTKPMPDGSNFAYVRIVAKLTKFWDLRQYPLDSHNLDINIEEEENETALVHYVADTENSGADLSQISMPGWKLADAYPVTGLGNYHSNFGDISLQTNKESSYSRLTLRMKLVREGDLVFLKLLFGVWVGAGISFVAFFIPPNRIDPRFGVGVGAIFAAIASEYIVTQSLPDTNTVTLADKLHVLANLFPLSRRERSRSPIEGPRSRLPLAVPDLICSAECDRHPLALIGWE